MIDCLVLRLDAPLMSFGDAAVDATRTTGAHPGRSFLTGLLGNALGWEHRDVDDLQRLQDRLSHASRCDRRGARLVDYHTVDLGADFMTPRRTAWTTRGSVEERRGGEASAGTHIKLVHYHADAAHVVVLTLRRPDESPTLDELERALAQPARPLFLGRKCCLPAAPLLDGRVQAESLLAALLQVAPSRRADAEAATVEASWPEEDGASAHARLVSLADLRDWPNQIHAGRRRAWIGQLPLQRSAS